MYRTARVLGFLTLTSAILAGSGSEALAAENTMYPAAANYRRAAIAFEKVVQRTRGIVRSDQRVVDRFEEATRDLVNASRNRRHVNRLRYAYRDLLKLQADVEVAIFEKYTLQRELVRAWQSVLYAQLIFDDEFVFFAENPNQTRRVQRRPQNSNRIQRLLSGPSTTNGTSPLAPPVGWYPVRIETP